MSEKKEYKCPVKEGDIVELKCESKGEKGDGIFKFEGFVIIVPETEMGSTYKIKINVVKFKVAFGEIAGPDDTVTLSIEEESEPEETEEDQQERQEEQPE